MKSPILLFLVAGSVTVSAHAGGLSLLLLKLVPKSCQGLLKEPGHTPPPVGKYADVPDLEELGFNPWGQYPEERIDVMHESWAGEPYLKKGAYSPEHRVVQGAGGLYPSGLYVFSKADYILSDGSLDFLYSQSSRDGQQIVEGNFGRYLGKLIPINVPVVEEGSFPIVSSLIGNEFVVNFTDSLGNDRSEFGTILRHSLFGPLTLVFKSKVGQEFAVEVGRIRKLRQLLRRP